MTTPAGRGARRERLAFWSQRGGALVAVAASLAALSLPGTARADTPTYDQMTGVGPTASAITVPWIKGVLDNTNTAIASANADRTTTTPSAADPLAFMNTDFQNLSVTVSQTQDLGHQGVTVSWNWAGGQTIGAGPVQADFLQMMECWGDASSGPSPEQCEYGSAGLLPSSADARIGEREGDLCPAGSVSSTTSPPSSASGAGPSDGCDPQEPGSAPTDHIAPCPGPYCTADTFNIPFSPVSDPSTLDYAGATDTTYYSEFNTDEVQLAVTGSDGTGQQQFETLTGTQAPGLGCGQVEADKSPRGCWLVIVPRGTYEPNGYHINANSSFFMNTSPLSASNWAQRIQIHLGFAPLESFCAPGTLERQTFGTQLVARAMQSWQLKLNQDANCAKIYGYSAVPEATSTLNLAAGGDSGLAFTTIPIGSEATRSGGGPPGNLPTILYAPVAVAALDFGFDINEGTGYVTTPVKLTPLLLAKALTQSYRQDLPDYFPDQGFPGPDWAKASPLNISVDPTFHALNPEVPQDPTGPIAPLLTEDHSALNQQTWQWIQSSSAATTWLGGTADKNDQSMVVDPDYQALKLGTAPAIDSFPRAYSACLNLGTYPGPPPKPETKCTLDLLPYTDNFDSAAAAVLAGNNADETGTFSSTNTAPDGTVGWWSKFGVEPLGQVFMWAADNTTDLAAYGLVPAQLCDDAGTSCVSPSTGSVTTAVAAAKADSAGLLQVDPANPGTSGYPLTQIIYAAVPTNQSAAALTDYASLIAYAAGTGQTTGAAPGDLPPGYLPLPSNLVSQAQTVVTKLQALASPSPSASASASSPASSASSSSQSPSTSTTTASGASTSAAGPAGATGTAAPTPTPAPAGTPARSSGTSPSSVPTKVPATGSTHPGAAVSGATTPGGPVTSLPAEQPAAGITRQLAVGAVRWVLIGVAITGGVFAGGGTLLSSGGLLPWRRRLL